jgi:hypothetical protein
VRTIHVVDDIEIDRDQIADLLEGSGKASRSGAVGTEANIITWRFIWELVCSEKLKKGDIVISDLYPEGYWKQVPLPMLYPPSKSLPGDPTNLYKATLDVIQRFMRQVRKRDAHLIVITYVPNWIQQELGIPILANKIRSVLDAEKFEFYEKANQFEDDACFRKAADRAIELLEQTNE